MTRSQLNNIVKELETKIKADHPRCQLKWTMPMTKNKDGSAGARLHQSMAGFNPRILMVHVMADGRWWTI